jgi:DegV family protein with EDD domain
VPIQVVTDSTCDLPGSVVQELGIRVIPMYLHIGTVDYLDGVDLSREDFYAGLPGYGQPPTTAAPGIDAFGGIYEQLAVEGATGIVSIHISETLSNVVNVARLAAQRIKSVPVTVIDSGQLTMGVGFEVLRAVEVARAGGTMEEVVAAVRDLIPRTQTFAALSTVEFLRRSGRLTQFQAGLATVLRILPLLRMHNGVAEMEKVRTQERALRRVLQLLSDAGPLQELAIVHTNAPQKAVELHERAQALIPSYIEPIYAQVTPVIGAHIGPGAVGFVAVARSGS